MAIIRTPVQGYSGVSCGVIFAGGVGETDDQHLIEWFTEHGYIIENEPKQATKSISNIDINDMTVAELKAYALEKGIDLGKIRKKADIIAVIAEREE